MSDGKDGELPRIPELADDFQLIRELGRGGTSVVYLARDLELGRDVAIKLIRPSYVRDEDALARLIREARTVGKLQHPGIVMLLGARRLQGHGLALILQYVPGITLKERIESQGPLPFAEVEWILEDLGRALAYAHAQRIVHRDIKPENVYLDETARIARLADFGLARAWDSDSGLTLPGTTIGTPTYMSPEQMDGADLDGRSDLYSLGLVGYEMVTGEQPWSGQTLYGIIYKQRNEELPPLSELRPDTPDHIRRAIEGAIRKDPADRWRSAERLLEELGVKSDTGTVPSADRRGAERARWAGATEPAVSSPEVSSPEDDWESLLDAVEAAVAGSGAGAADGGEPEVDRVDDPNDIPLSESSDVPSESSDAPAVAGSGLAPRRRRSRALFLGATTALLLIAVAAVLVGGGMDPLVTASRGAWGAVSGAFGARTGDAAAAAQPEDPFPPPSESVPSGGSNGTTGLDRYTLPEPSADPADPGVALPLPDLSASPDSAAPFAVGAVGGGNQEGTAGEPLADPLAVRVLDASGAPIAGIAVSFSVAAGSGRVEPAVATTDADGRARVTWVLGALPGAQSVVAAVQGVPGGRITFGATAIVSRLAIQTGVAVGGTHSCSLRPTGEVFCWGSNGAGQLGAGSGSGRTLPGLIGRSEPLTRLASGLRHVCGLDAEGVAWCWGADDSDPSGSGDGTSVTPTSVAGGIRFVEIVAGVGHTCGLTGAGGLYCWGANESGQLGDGTTEARNAPTPVGSGTTFRAVAAGWRHTCALDEGGRAYCWGAGDSGELGSSAAAAFSPTPVGTGIRFQSIAAGNAHTCGIAVDGALYCWGANEGGQLGDGTTSGSPSPRAVDSAERFTSVAAGGVHTCALTATGIAHCWGRNPYGQLGDGTLQNRSVPAPVAGSARFSRLDAMGSHNCGQTSAGEVLCWGFNVEGQLGDGTRENRAVPTPVPM